VRVQDVRSGVQVHMTSRIWRIAVICNLIPICASAQPAPTPAELEARLRSPSIATAAWAAFQAGALGVTETVPTLAEVLQSPPQGNPHERDYFAAAVLDALAQMPFWPGGPGDTPVPPAAVGAHFDRWPLQTIVVLARVGPAADTVTLELLRSWPGRQSLRMAGDQWFALANLLVPRSPIGFASLLLRDISFELRVTVSDGAAGLLGSVGGGAGVADGIAQKPVGFPPHAEYQWDRARAGSLVMSSGPRTVYYRRVVSWRDQFGTAYPSTAQPTVDDRLGYLAAVAHRSGPFGLRQSTSFRLIWKGPDAFTRAVREQQRRISDQYDLLLEELVAAGRLTKEEADALPLRIATTVEDARTKRAPLPAVPFVR
jgi:hypothetical protein